MQVEVNSHQGGQHQRGESQIPTTDVQRNATVPLTTKEGSLALETTLRASAVLTSYFRCNPRDIDRVTRRLSKIEAAAATP